MTLTTTPRCAGCGFTEPPIIHVEVGPGVCFVICTTCAVPLASYILSTALDADVDHCEAHHQHEQDRDDVQQLDNLFRLPARTPADPQ